MVDVAASVLARLKNKAAKSGRSYQLCLQIFCQEEFLRRLALLNTIPETQGAGCSKIKYLSVAPMFGEAIERIYQEISIAKLFN